MAKKKSGKIAVYLYVILTIAGCILACSSLIANDYLKLVIVIATLCIGLFGIMRGLNSPDKPTNSEIIEDK